MNKPPNLLTVFEVAAITRASERTVRRWIADGKLQALYAGRLCRIEASDLNAFLKRGRLKRKPGPLPRWLARQFEAAERERTKEQAE